MYIRLQSWFPFDAQVYLNGRSYLARALKREGIRFEQCDNCLISIENVAHASKILDRLKHRSWVPTLARFVERVNPLLREELAGIRPYYWVIHQAEFATDIVFKDAKALGEIYGALTRHAVDRLLSEDILRYLGYRRPGQFRGRCDTTLRRRREGVRVKHVVDENSIKWVSESGSLSSSLS